MRRLVTNCFVLLHVVLRVAVHEPCVPCTNCSHLCGDPAGLAGNTACAAMLTNETCKLKLALAMCAYIADKYTSIIVCAYMSVCSNITYVCMRTHACT